MPEKELKPVTYAAPGPDAAFQHRRICHLPLGDVLWRIREAVETADLWILHEIDAQLMLRRGGYAIGPARKVLFFHPRYVGRILEADQSALLEAPLKFIALQQPDGTTAINWHEPAISFARYRKPELTELGQELSGLCEFIAEAACRRP